MSKAYIFLAEGFEEVEALTVVDILRRAGVDAKTVSVSGDLTVTGSHKISVIADLLFEDADFSDAAMAVLPGGIPGAPNLRDHKGLTELLVSMKARGSYVTAICASPAMVLGTHGILSDKAAICYDGMEDSLNCKEVVFKNVVTDGNVVTSRGPATAMEFALELAGLLMGSDVKKKVSDGLLMPAGK